MMLSKSPDELRGTPSPHSTKKILFVISTMSAGGAERVASIMLHHWVDAGLETELLTFTPASADHYPLPEGLHRRVLNISWVSRNPLSSLFSNLRRLRMIRQEIKLSSPDVVVSFIERTNIMVMCALLGSAIPVIVSERVDPRMYKIRPTWSILRKLVYRFAAQIVVQTEAAADWALTHTPQDRVSVIRNPLSSLPAPMPWEERRNQIVSMGRMVPQKGFDVLVRAFAASHAPASGWQLVIVGDGPERSAIELLLQELDIENSTKLTGVMKETAAVLNETKIFVLASRFEGFPNALLEGMAMGCACVASDCYSGPAEIVQDGHNGLLVPVEDVKLLTRAINRLVDHPNEAQALTSHAQEVRGTHSKDRIMSQWDDLLDSVMAYRGERIDYR